MTHCLSKPMARLVTHFQCLSRECLLNLSRDLWVSGKHGESSFIWISAVCCGRVEERSGVEGCGGPLKGGFLYRVSQKNVPLSHKNVSLDQMRTSYSDTAQKDKKLLRTFHGTLERFFGTPDN